MGCAQSKEVENEPPPPAPEIKWKNEKQAKVMKSLHSVHQPRHTRLIAKVALGTKKYAKRNCQIYTWYERPVPVSAVNENEKDLAVYKTVKQDVVVKANGKIDIPQLQYDHSLVDLEFRDGLFHATGFEKITAHWYKPGGWTDELRMDLNLKLFYCEWLLPGEQSSLNRRDARGKSLNPPPPSDDMCLFLAYPPGYHPISICISMKGQSAEFVIEKSKKDLEFYYGFVKVVRAGETRLSIIVDQLLPNREEKGELLKDYPIKISFELRAPQSVISDTLLPNQKRMYDKPLEAKQFKELLLWQKPLPRSFIPDVTPTSSLIFEVEKLVSYVDGKWLLKRVNAGSD